MWANLWAVDLGMNRKEWIENGKRTIEGGDLVHFYHKMRIRPFARDFRACVAIKSDYMYT